MINSKKLTEKMKQEHVTQKDISAALEIARPTVSQKINNVRPMYLDEAERICDILNIPACEFGEYFFCDKNCVAQ